MKKIVTAVVAGILILAGIGIGSFFLLQVDADAARQIAMDRVGESDAEVVQEKIEREWLMNEYEFTFETDTDRYEVSVSAFGDVVAFEQSQLRVQTETRSEQTQGTQTDIGSDQAREIALSRHAQGQVTDFEREVQGNALYYEIEILEGRMEYDYIIDGYTGNILSSSEEPH